MAEKLEFFKPLRLDGALFLPDLILTGGKQNVIMEIFGIDNDPEYQAQKEKKNYIIKKIIFLTGNGHPREMIVFHHFRIATNNSLHSTKIH